MHQPKAFLFGAPRIERDGARVLVERRKTMALLAYLATMPGAHARTTLSALLWPEVDATQARANLSRTLVDLRTALGPASLHAEPDRVGLDPGELFVDARAFRAALARVTAHGHGGAALCDDCLAAAASAVELYREDFLAGFSLRDAPDFDTWQTLQTETLRLELGETLESLARTYLARNDPARGLPPARRWLSLDPLSEPAHRCVMRLHAAAGDRAAACAQYEACRAALQSELGIPPEYETTALFEQLKSGAAAPAQAERGRPAPVRGVNNLPAEAGPFIGREAELATVAARLADPACRLLTITGPGGTGKTRLAVEAGRGQLAHFPHGVCFVSLLGVSRSELVPGAVLQALGATAASGLTPPQQAGQLLAERRLLLILDNFEHLLAAAEDGGEDATVFLREWLAAAPGLKLLVTARERLNLRDEWLLPLAGLALPDAAEPTPAGAPAAEAGAAADLAAYAATRYFLHCAQQVRPGYTPDATAGRAIVRICRQVDGSPLAIELVAAWLRALPLAEIERRLAQGLDLLAGGPRDLPSRHRSMAAVFDQSWRLLTDHEAAVLRCCAVLRDGFTAEAAQAIAGASLADLAGLVDRSWLRLLPSGRYDLHELTRQYCAARLDAEHLAQAGETRDDVLERHDAYFTEQLDRWEQASRAAGYRLVDDVALLGDTGKLEDVWRRAVAADNVERIRLLLPLYELQYLLGPTLPDIDLLDAAIERLEAISRLAGPESVRSRALYPLGFVLLNQSERCCTAGRWEQAGRRVAECRALLAREGPGMEGWAEFNWLLRVHGIERMGQEADRSLLIAASRETIAQMDSMPDKMWPYRSGPRPVARYWQVAHLGALLVYEGLYGEGRRLLEEAISELRHMHPFYPQCVLSETLWHQGEYQEGKRVAQESMRDSRATGSIFWFGIGLMELARNETALGELAEAREHFRQSIAIWQSIDYPAALAGNLAGLGEIETALGRPAEAVALCREALSHLEQSNLHGDPYVAIAALGLGQAQVALGETREAWASYRRALRVPGKLARTTMETLASAAELTGREGDPLRATELLAFVAGHPYTPHWVGRSARRLLAELEAELPPDAYATAVARGQARDLAGVVAELAGEESSADRPV